MTRSETLRIMAVLKAAYPQYYTQMEPEEAAGVVNLWYEMMIDYSYELTAMAVRRYIAQDREYPPSIGQVIASINAIQRPPEDDLTEGAAWSMVRRAISNGIYHSAEEYAKFPPVLQRIVGSHEQLHNWALMDSDQVESQIRPMICRSYAVQAEREREQLALPPSLAKQLAGMVKAPELAAPKRQEMPAPAPDPRPRQGESPAYLAFMDKLRSLVEDKPEETVVDDDIRDHDAEARARLEEQYEMLKGAKSSGAV